jgi:hypothetical protein
LNPSRFNITNVLNYKAKVKRFGDYFQVILAFILLCFYENETYKHDYRNEGALMKHLWRGVMQ